MAPMRGLAESGVGDATLCINGDPVALLEEGDSFPVPVRVLVLGALEPSAEVSFRVAGGRPGPPPGFLFLNRNAIFDLRLNRSRQTQYLRF